MDFIFVGLLHQNKSQHGTDPWTIDDSVYTSLLLHNARHAICHGCTDIISVKYLFFGVNFCSEHTVFCQKSALVAFNGLLVTHLVALSMDVYYVK